MEPWHDLKFTYKCLFDLKFIWNEPAINHIGKPGRRSTCIREPNGSFLTTIFNSEFVLVIAIEWLHIYVIYVSL